MIINRKKMELAMARACVNSRGLAETAQMPVQTINGVLRGRNIRPGTLGKIARALDVDPADIIEEEATEQ
ncbi:helix-turn-helix domain-containing protein [Flavonifractor plautii]|uniref:helix-turn-helix domain-containing protein n=2 Tax=Flavonifractor plautii TaxID=292800 RepID=UPI0012AB581E